MTESALKLISSEFKLWGVKPQVDLTGSNHYKFTWRATPDKEERVLFVAKTPSDGRGNLNCRAQLRRYFKQDNIADPREVAHRQLKPVLHKALNTPEPVERDVDQIKILRSEVGDLTDLVLEMAALISSMRSEMQTASPPTAPAETIPAFLPSPTPTAPPIAPSTPAALPPPVLTKTSRLHSTRSIQTIEYISDSWSSTDALARDMGLNRLLALRKLKYLEGKGQVECSFDRWRRKPGAIEQALAAEAVAQLDKARVPTLRVVSNTPGAKHAGPAKNGKSAWEYIDVLDHLTDKWQSTGALAEVMKLSSKRAYNRLYNRMRKDNGIEFSDGCWRLKQTATKVIRTGANGHHHARH